MGRPTKLTPEVQKTICDLIANGNTRECAAGCAGVDPATLYRWMADPENCEFREAIEKADAQAEARHVMVIVKAAQAGTWQAAARWLEARRAKDWQRRERVEHDGVALDQGGTPIQFVVSVPPLKVVTDDADAGA